MKEIRIGIERLVDSELQRAIQEYPLFAVTMKQNR